MFLGEHQHALDTKGRLTIPARFREKLGERFVATKGFDNCIFLYPIDEWQIIEGKLRNLPMTRADTRSFVRFFFSGASEMELDKQGRIVLPSSLRDHAEVDKELYIIGVGQRVEIWAAQLWEQYSQKAVKDFEVLAESLVDLGI